MSDRGMKKWAPYKSLSEQEEYLQKTRYSKVKIEKPIISNEAAEEINNILVNYEGQPLLVKYFRNGKIYEEEIVIKSIEPIEKKLVLVSRRIIKLNEIFELIQFSGPHYYC